jgi:hypothetical protein
MSRSTLVAVISLIVGLAINAMTDRAQTNGLEILGERIDLVDARVDQLRCD